ncbi:hypothetical protein IAT38_005805 [Cryptococcus sp. DSM 104549]
MPDLAQSTSNPPRSLARYCSGHVPTPLPFLSTTDDDTSGPTESTLELFRRTFRQGIRVVYDPSLNHRLEGALRRHFDKDAKVPRFLDVLTEAAEACSDLSVENEAQLSARMASTFFYPSRLVIQSGLVGALAGVWKECPDQRKSGVSGWRFYRPATEEKKEETATVWILIHPSMLTSVPGESFEPRCTERAEPEGAEGQEEERGEGDTVDEESRAAELIRLCSQPGGLIIGLAREEGEDEARPKVLDKEGTVVPGLTYWANVFGQFHRYQVDLVTISTYELNIPIERDRLRPTLLRVGHPIHRNAATVGVGLGRLTPMELSIASVIPERHRSTLNGECPKIPTNALALTATTSTKDEDPDAREGGCGEAVGQGGGRGAGSAQGGRKRPAGEMPDDGGQALEPRETNLLMTIPPHIYPKCLHLLIDAPEETYDIRGHIHPSLLLDRPHSPVLPDPSDQAPPANTPSPSTPVPRPHVTLAKPLGSGHLWDAYIAHLNGPGLSPTTLVAKIILPSMFDDTWGTGTVSERAVAAARACGNESALYAGPLSALQGAAVPLLYGDFVGRTSMGPVYPDGFEIRVLLLEDVGKEAVPEGGRLRALPYEDRVAIRDLYTQLHSARVLHKDIEPRHVRRRADGRFALIDFEGAYEVGDHPTGREALRQEALWVDRLLGVTGA